MCSSAPLCCSVSALHPTLLVLDTNTLHPLSALPESCGPVTTLLDILSSTPDAVPRFFGDGCHLYIAYEAVCVAAVAAAPNPLATPSPTPSARCIKIDIFDAVAPGLPLIRSVTPFLPPAVGTLPAWLSSGASGVSFQSDAAAVIAPTVHYMPVTDVIDDSVDNVVSCDSALASVAIHVRDPCWVSVRVWRPESVGKPICVC